MEDKNMNFLNFAPLIGGAGGQGGIGQLILPIAMVVVFGVFFCGRKGC